MPRRDFDAARLEALFSSLRPHDRIGLAVSGGADSLALMMLYSAWRPDGGKPAAVVYSVDHGLRAESAREVAFVIKLAERYGFPARGLRWEGPYPETGIQAAARAARYRLIGDAMAADGVSVLATGHQRDDQAETVLMRLAHGSGAAGLAGMRQQAVVEGITVVRPLLSCSRKELAAVVSAEDVIPVEDPSNAHSGFERVRWRQALGGLAPLGLSAERLAGFAQRMARLDALAQAATARFLEASVTIDGFGVCRIDRAALAQSEAEVAVRTLMACLGFAGGGQPEKLAAVEAAAEALQSGEEIRETLMGAQIATNGDRCLVFREVRRMGEQAMNLRPGRAVVFDRRFRVEAQREGFVLHSGAALTRAALETWLGLEIDLPIAAVHGAPVVHGQDGEIVAIGTHVREAHLGVIRLATAFAPRR